MNQQQKPKKKKGPIRFEAIIPILVVVGLLVLYFTLFFDLHLKKAIEWGGYQALGAEVDVDSLDTSFIKGTFQMKGLKLTNSQNPMRNSLEIGDIRFSVLWDGLLRARLVVDEMAIEQIAIDTPRKTKGRVKPPEEVEKEQGPGAVDELKDKTLDKIQSDQQENLMGDLAAVASGTSGDAQLKSIEDSLASKTMIKKLEADFQEKSKAWQAKVDSLPKGKEIEELGSRLSKVKTKDFKSPQELQQSLQEIDKILKEADQKYKLVQSTSQELSTDLTNFDQSLKALDKQVREDIDSIEKRLKIPKLDAKSLSKYLFYQYAGPYLTKANQYKNLADKYLPPKFKNKDKSTEAQIKPHPRAKGVTYEFGKQNSYPMFWIKNVSISSKAQPEKNMGQLAGKITNITSNQVMINKPTVAQLAGDFPSHQIVGFLSKLTVDARPEPNVIQFDFGVGSAPMDGKNLVESSDVKIGFKQASQSIQASGVLTGLRDIKMNLRNTIQKVEYDIAAKDSFVDGLLKGAFAQVPSIYVNVEGSGSLPLPSLNISSNLGEELERAIRQQLQKKLEEQKQKIQAMVNEYIGKEKAKLEGDYNRIKGQLDGEVKKITDQVNKQKSTAEAKVNDAKKDQENQAKKQVENEVKKALGNDADKKLEDLKKKFGL